MTTTQEEGSMTAPEAHAGLAAALAAVQAELPEVKKTRTAKVEKDGRLLYTYDYADLADVSLAILPLLGKHGLAFMAVPGHQENGKFGLRYYLLHSGGAQVEGFYEIAEQGGMQMVGGRITYARRYCLCAVTGIAAEEDVDAREDGQQPSRTAQRRQQPAASRGEQQQQNTAPRRAPAARNQRTAPPGDLPPLPGEDEPDPTTSGASSSARAPGSASPQPTGRQSPSSPGGSATAPDESDYDTPGTVTRPQLTRIWATLTEDIGYPSSGKDAARATCAAIIGRDITSSNDLSHREAGTVIDTLSAVLDIARRRGGDPRAIIEGLTRDPRAAALTELSRLGITGTEAIADTAGSVLRIVPPASLESLTTRQATSLAATLARCVTRDDMDALLATGEVPGAE